MFWRHGDEIRSELSDRERALLSQIPALLESVGVVEGDPAYSALHRPVYTDDADADVALAELVAADIRAQRRADQAVVESVASGTGAMTDDEARGFLRSINEARLVLAARAGAFEAGPVWEDQIAKDPGLAAVAWLGYLQAELIETLSGT